MSANVEDEQQIEDHVWRMIVRTYGYELDDAPSVGTQSGSSGR
jgi:hypothetical protein